MTREIRNTFFQIIKCTDESFSPEGSISTETKVIGKIINISKQLPAEMLSLEDKQLLENYANQILGNRSTLIKKP